MGSPSAADNVEERILEHEHLALRAGLSTIAGTLEDAHRLSRFDLAERVARTTSWLHREFLPHAAWEETWLFDQLDRATDSPWTTRALRFQHDQIRELATALEQASVTAHAHWTNEIAFRLVTALARLEATISTHLSQEERFVLALLEHPAGATARAGG